MPINPSGDSIYDGDCLKYECNYWGGDGLCILSIEYTIYDYQRYDLKKSLLDHLIWRLNFWKKKYWDDWHLSLWEHLKGKLRIWYPIPPHEKENEVGFCILDVELREDWEDPDYEDYWDELYHPLNY